MINIPDPICSQSVLVRNRTYLLLFALQDQPDFLGGSLSQGYIIIIIPFIISNLPPARALEVDRALTPARPQLVDLYWIILLAHSRRLRQKKTPNKERIVNESNAHTETLT